MRLVKTLVLLFFTASAGAADYYWVGGSGNWSDFSNHWATTSGGSTMHTAAPGITDNVFLDDNSFANLNDTLFVDVAGSCNNIHFNTSANVKLDAGFVVNDTFDLEQGSFFCNGNNIQCGSFYTNYFSPRSLDLDGVTMTVVNDSIAWNATAINLTLSQTGATIQFGYTGANTVYFQSGGSFMTYETLLFTSSSVEFTSATTVTNVTFVSGSKIVLPSNAGNEFAATNITMIGTCAAPIILTSSDPGNQAIMDIGGGAFAANFTRISNIDATNGTYNAINSIDEGNNTGWAAILEDPSSVVVTWIGGTGDWSDPSNWSTGCIPGPNDNVVFNAGSFTGNQTVTVDINAYCHDMTWTGILPDLPNFTGPESVIINGSLTFSGAETVDVEGNFIFNGAAIETITTNGAAIASDYWMSGIGQFTLTDNLTTTGSVIVDQGIFDANGTTVTCSSFLSNTGNTRTVNIANSNITLTGTGTVWDLTTGGLTFTQVGSEIHVNHTNTDHSDFYGGDRTYNTVRFFNTQSAIYGDNTFSLIEIAQNSALALESGTNQNIDSLIALGNCAGIITIESTDNLGIAANITKTNYDTLIVSSVTINNVTADATGNLYNLNMNGTLLNNTAGWDTTDISAGADYFWVGGSGDWSDITHWESPSGVPATCLPNLRDTVNFPATSFSPASSMVTVDIDAACAKMDWTGSDIWIPELHFVRNLDVRHDVILNSTMSISNSNELAELKFIPENNNSEFVTFGASVDVNVLHNGSQLLDTLSLNGDLILGDTSSLVIVQGTFMSMSDSIKAGTFTAASANPKQITLDDSNVELVFGLNFNALTNLDAGTSWINLTGSIIPDFFYGNGLNYNDVTIRSLSSDTSTFLTGSNVFNDLTFGAGLRIVIENGASQTVNGVFLADGNCQDSIFISSQTAGVQTDINLVAAGNAECINVQDVDVPNAAITALFSTDYGNNTGNWIFSGATPSNADYTTTFNICIGDTAFFTNTSTAFAGGLAALDFYWEFDYADTSTAQDPSYLFNSGGLHYVQLTTTFTNHCQDVYLDSVQVNDPTVTLSFSDADTSICQFEQVFFNATSPGATSYNFLVNGVTEQLGALSSWDTTGLADGDTVRVEVDLNGCTQLSDDYYAFEVIPAPVIPFLSTDADNVICDGDSITFTASGADIYQFFLNTTPLTGLTTDSTYTIATLVDGDTMSIYGTDMTSGCGDSGIVAHVHTVNPLPAPTLTSSDADLVICAGDPVTFTGGASTDFEFFVNGISAQGPSALNTFNTTGLANGDVVSVVGTDLGCSASSSQTYSFFVNPIPAITLSNSTGTTICAGESVTFTASGATTYEYYVNGALASGPTGSVTFTTNTLNNGEDVYVTGSANNCSASTTPEVFTVVAIPTVALASSDIDNQICAEDIVTYTASGASTYEFFINGVSLGAPAASNVYSTDSLSNGQTISVVGYNTGCEGVGTPTFTMTVEPKFNINVFTSDADLSICAGDNIDFTSIGAGVTSYELFVDGISQGVSATGNYNTTTLPIGTPNVWASGTKNGCTYFSQDTLAINVTTLPTVAMTSSDADTAICNGDSVTFTGSGASTYEFLIDGLSYGVSANPSLTVTNLTHGQVVTLNGYDLGCGNSSADAYTFTVSAVPTVSIASNDADNIICEGDTIEISGAGATDYELFMDGVSVGPASVTNLYELDTLTTNHSFYFSGAISGCSDESALINVQVNPLPVISATVSDVDTTICAGDNISFDATGGGTYEFFVNGISTGSPGPSPTFSSTTLLDGDVITVEGTNVNGCSSLAADVFNLTVNPLPVVTLNSTEPDSTICIGDDVTFTSTGATGYTYYLNNDSVQIGNTYQTDSIQNGDIITVIGTENGCNSIQVNIPYTVYQYPSVTLTSDDLDNEICFGDAVTYTAAGALEYTYLVNGTPVQGPGPINTFNTLALNNGDVITVDGSNNGCSTVSSAINMIVYNYPSSVLTSSDPNNTICFGESVTFSGSGATTFEFLINGLSQGSPSAVNTFTTTFLEDGDVITLVGRNGHCPDTSTSLTFVVHTLPLTLNPSGSNVICNGNNTTFTATGADLYEFFIDGTPVQGPSAANTYSTSALTDGQVVTVNGTSIATGCTQTSQTSHLMVVLNNPTITALTPTTICEGDSVLLQSSFNNWNNWFLDGVALPGETDTILYAHDAGDYTVEIAIGGNDEIWSVGGNVHGQLGDSSFINSLPLIESINLQDIVDTEAGQFSGIAMDNAGSVYTWGNNDFGQLGNGNFTTQSYAYQTNITTAADIAAGDDHVAACLTDGTVQAWGKNTFGQLGHGNLSTINFPLTIATLNNIIEVEAGANHTLALRNDGTVWAWGDNQFGQLGDSTTTDRLAPVQVYGLTNVVKIACGANHSMAIDNNGDLYVWGNNSTGQLGMTGFQFSIIPVWNGMGNIDDVKGGNAHTLVLNGNNKLYAFGNNNHGQLGDGTNTASSTPLQITALDAVTIIGAGYNSSFAVKADQSVWSWGNNSSGQLGTENTIDSNIPVHVPPLTGAIDFGVGSEHVAQLSSQSTACPSAIETVTVNPTPNAIVTEAGGVLSAAPAGIAYQWYIDGLIIPSATGPTHTPTTAGYYTCEITYTGGCTSLSNEYPHNIVGVYNQDAQLFSLYPNPNNGRFLIRIADEMQNADLFIRDISGKVVYRKQGTIIDNQQITLNVQSGLYMMTIINGNNTNTVQLIVRN